MLRIDGRTKLSDQLQELGFAHITGLIWFTNVNGQTMSAYIGENVDCHFHCGVWQSYLADYGITHIVVVNEMGEVWIYSAEDVPDSVDNFLSENLDPARSIPMFNIDDLNGWQLKTRSTEPYQDFDGRYPPYPFTDQSEVTKEMEDFIIETG